MKHLNNDPYDALRGKSLEELHRSIFPPREDHLRRLIEAKRLRELQREGEYRYVVTYGAFEKPIL